jgi:signal transduction histidine kinase
VSPRSLTVRLIFAASIAILLALVVVGAGVDLLVARHLHRSLDDSLRSRAVDIAQLSVSAPALLTQPGVLDAPGGGTQLVAEILDRQDRLVARSLGLGDRIIPVIPTAREVIASGRARYTNVESASKHFRVFVAPLSDSHGPASGGAVVVAASTEELQETLTSVRLFVLVAALAGAAAAAVALAVLMRRALAPLGRLTQAAAEIEQTGDARQRLPEAGSDDEIGRLAITLNGMLAALERARDAERRFLADASHELRTPLTALRGNVEYLRRHGASDELVADLHEDTTRLARLTDDLLAISREEATPLPDDVVRLDQLVGRLEGVTVLTTEPVSVRGDSAALERAVQNLVENAQRHGSGTISVSVTRSGDRAVLVVEDEGAGLDSDHAEQAFSRFWRGSNSGPGSGLGLAIVRATAERHGGRAYAEDARFTIELPALRAISESTGTTGGEEPEKGSP